MLKRTSPGCGLIHEGGGDGGSVGGDGGKGGGSDGGYGSVHCWSAVPSMEPLTVQHSKVTVAALGTFSAPPVGALLEWIWHHAKVTVPE